MRHLLIQLTPGETSAPPSAPENTLITVIETGSRSAPMAMTTTTMEILEELTHQMVE